MSTFCFVFCVLDLVGVHLLQACRHFMQIRGVLTLRLSRPNRTTYCTYCALTKPFILFVIFAKLLNLMAHPGRLERPACGFEVRRSIQLSYGCAALVLSILHALMRERNVDPATNWGEL